MKQEDKMNDRSVYLGSMVNESRYYEDIGKKIMDKKNNKSDKEMIKYNLKDN